MFRAALPPFEYLAATSVPEALRLLAKFRGRAVLLAGGTDVLVQMRTGKRVPEAVIDIKRVAALGGGVKVERGGRIAIGALTTLADIEHDAKLRRLVPLLPEAVATMASPQVRNRGTIGGNLCNAAPSADTAPPLLALDALVRLHTRKGVRTMPLAEFFTGPGRTALGTDAVLGAILVPKPPRGLRAAFRKHGVREAMECAVVSVAVAVAKERGTIRHARVVLGAVAPTPLRVPAAEALLVGHPGGPLDLLAAAGEAADAARPITDVRGSSDYRRDVVRTLVRRALEEVAG
ncbi:MAG: xanthine dehydrogenase family protein subunit M [Deltaproteobacteria bacterium]|nr:xanthine dehydrogenase family protein subunit M [Deltaproteobacteria bacterium]